MRIFRAGNQSGKTTIGCVDTLLHLLGWHPFSRHRGAVHWWASALDWEFGVGQVLWPKMREWIPWDQVRTVHWYRKNDPELPGSIFFRNGSTLTFKSADSKRKKYQGASLHGVWVDEEHPPDVVEEIAMRLVKHAGYFSVTVTPVMRARWVLEYERKPHAFCVRASMTDAARAGVLDAEAVHEALEGLPDRQREVREKGEFVALEGLVYPQFSAETHVAHVRDGGLWLQGKRISPYPIPREWERRAAIDFGYSNPTAVPVAARCPVTNRLIFETCYYASWIRTSVWARLMAGDPRNGKPRLLPSPLRSFVADHDADGRAELDSIGLRTTPAEKEVLPGIEAVERFLTSRAKHDGLPMLVLVNDPSKHNSDLGRCDADKIRWEMEAYHYPEQREDVDARDLPVKKDDHAMDAVRYLVIAYERSLNRSGPVRIHRAAAPDNPFADARINT